MLPLTRAWIFSSVTSGAAALERRAGGGEIRFVDAGYRDFDNAYAEIPADDPRVAERLSRRVRGRHRDADDAIRAERVGGHGRDEGGIDPAAHAENDLREAVLVHVVARAENEGAIHLFDRVEVRRAPRDGRSLPAKRRKGREIDDLDPPVDAVNGDGSRAVPGLAADGSMSATRRSSSNALPRAIVLPSGAAITLHPSKTSSSWAADEVDVAEPAAVLAGALLHELLALPAFPAMIGRGRYIDNDARAAEKHLRGGRPVVDPDVLADAYSYGTPPKFTTSAFSPGSKYRFSSKTP